MCLKRGGEDHIIAPMFWLLLNVYPYVHSLIISVGDFVKEVE